jgi:hypothetical protein
MTGSLSKAEIRRRAFNAVNQDGLLDITVGFMLLVLSGYMYNLARHTPGRTLPVTLLWMYPFAMAILRRLITYPRTGFAQLRNGRGASVGIAALVVAILLSLGAFALAHTTRIRLPVRLVDLSPAIFSLAVIGTLGYTGLVLGARRFIVYAALAAAAAVATHAVYPSVADRLTLPFTGLALVMIPVGIVLLVSFLRRHPKPAKGEAS